MIVILQHELYHLRTHRMILVQSKTLLNRIKLGNRLPNDHRFDHQLGMENNSNSFVCEFQQTTCLRHYITLITELSIFHAPTACNASS